MKLNTIFLGIAILIFIQPMMVSCTRKAKPQVNTIPVPSPTTPKVPNPPMVSNDTIPSKVVKPTPVDKISEVINFKRTPCFGSCPAFEVKIFANGTAMYIGKKNVSRLGTHTAFVSQQWIDAVFTKAHDMQFRSLASTYPPDGKIIADFPTTSTAIVFKDTGLKFVKNNFDAPKHLQDFETWLQEKIDELPWKYEPENRD